MNFFKKNRLKSEERVCVSLQYWELVFNCTPKKNYIQILILNFDELKLRLGFCPLKIAEAWGSIVVENKNRTWTKIKVMD